MERPYPRAFAHVGVTVPDIDGAMDWYEEILGLDRVMDPVRVEAGEGHMGELCADVLDIDFEEVRIGHMATSDGTGVEFFEFDEVDEVAPNPRETGFFHVCVIDPDIEALAERIAGHGGEHTSEIWRLFPDREYRMTYCTDPFGNYVEIYTHGYERIYSNRE